MSNPNEPSVTLGWDTYWQGTRDADSYSSGGVGHPAVAAFWDKLLPEIFAAGDISRILDVATGSGAVLEKLVRQTADKNIDVSCVDISEAAIDRIHRRFSSINAVVADARSIPLESSQFDLITSQFGIEYAGLDALDEAARLLAQGGSLIMLMHIRPGIIYGECWASLDAIRRMTRSKFTELALEFFEAGFAAVRGGDRAPYEKAGLALNPALRKLERIMSDHGEDVAGGTVAKLYADVERIHTRIQSYEPEEVTEWLRKMIGELDAYEARMDSMCKAAMDKKAFRGLRKRLEDQGLTVVQGKPLLPARSSLPVAWILKATRDG